MRESLSSNSIDGGEKNDTWGCLVDPYIHSHTLSAYTYGHVHISNIQTYTHTDIHAHKPTHRHAHMHVQRNNIKSYWAILCFRKHKFFVHTCKCEYACVMCVCMCVSPIQHISAWVYNFPECLIKSQAEVTENLNYCGSQTYKPVIYCVSTRGLFLELAGCSRSQGAVSTENLSVWAQGVPTFCFFQLFGDFKDQSN